MASLLSEEQFQCSICLESFKNPVSIPCGHNFCLECIKHYWDVAHKSDCPLCKETFRHRPELKINVCLKDITETFQRSVKGTPRHRPAPANRHKLPRWPCRSEAVPCLICQQNKLTAVKSCHICQKSYKNHLATHQRDPVMMMHRLTDPATFSKNDLCRNHKVLEKFCKKNHVPVCMTCTEKDHKHHEIVPMEKELNEIKTYMKKTQWKYQQMMQTRWRLEQCGIISTENQSQKHSKKSFEYPSRSLENYS